MQVLDQHDNPSPGVVVVFEVSEGVPIAVTPSVTTNTEGRAAASVILGAQHGESRIDALVDGLKGSPAPFFITTTPYTLRPFGINSEDGTVGEELELPFTVLVEDGYGSFIAGETVTFATSYGFVNPTEAVSDENGRASTIWTLGPEPGDQVCRVELGPVGYNHILRAKAGPPGQILITDGDRQVVPFFRAADTDLRVRVLREQGGVPIVDRSVVFQVIEGNGTLSATRVKTSLFGYASTSITLNDSYVNRVEVSLPGIRFPVRFRIRGLEPIEVQGRRESPDSVRLSWSEHSNPDLLRYEIHRALETGDWSLLATISGDPSAREYLDETASAGPTYRYRLDLHFADDTFVELDPITVD